MPTRLASHELKALEARTKVAVFLDQEDHAGLVQGMKQSVTTAPDVEGVDKMGCDSTQTSGREPDDRVMHWGGRQGRRGQCGGRSLGWGSRLGRILR